MRPQDIKIGEYYRLKSSPDYGFVKAIEIISAKDKRNPTTRKIVKCEHTVHKNDNYGFMRYFEPSDLIKCKETK